MELIEYIQTHTTALAFAKKIGVPQSDMSVWMNKLRPIPAHHCPRIEKATGGLVPCEKLNPNVDWQYIRGTEKAA